MTNLKSLGTRFTGRRVVEGSLKHNQVILSLSYKRLINQSIESKMISTWRRHP